MPESEKQDVSLLEVARVCAVLGCTAYGGPAAHIAMMEDEFVTKRKWLTAERFLDLVGTTNLIPGPNSTEVMMHIGYERCGRWGMVVAGLAFIVPAVISTILLAWLYVSYGALPAVAPLLAGVKPAVIVIVGNACYRLAKKAMTSAELVCTSVLVVAMLLSGLSEVASLLLGGLIGTFLVVGWRRYQGTLAAGISMLVYMTPSVSLATSTSAASLAGLGLFFLKVGAVLYGSGYVLIAFLEGELVSEYGWLTQAQLIDAVAFGQFTPGPVLSTAAFIGYIIAGVPGAVVSSVAIFFPSFVFVLLLHPLIDRLRAYSWTSFFLDAINASAVALMLVVVCQLAIGSLVSVSSFVIFALVLLVFLWRAPSTPFLIGLGMVLGLISEALQVVVGI